MMKNAFYFASKSLFCSQDIQIFVLLCIAKQLDYKDKIDFKFYDATAWLTINFETHIAQYFEK